jgi:hypothetical protein
MVSLKFRTYKKAKEMEKLLDGLTRTEGKVAAFILLFLLQNDKELSLKEFGEKLPDIFWQTMSEYDILVSGDK